MAVYRSLLRLYPKEFRDEFGPDLLQIHRDLATDRGLAFARRRTALDLIVTIPRYRLEQLMSEEHSNTALYVVLVGLVAAGAVGVLTGIYPALVFVVAAAFVAVAQRSRLARAIRTPDTDVRHRRLRAATWCAAISVISVITYGWDLADDQISTASLLGHSLIGTTAMAATVVLLLAGLLTPRTPATV